MGFHLYTVQYTLYTIHCTLHTVHCTLYTVHSIDFQKNFENFEILRKIFKIILKNVAFQNFQKILKNFEIQNFKISKFFCFSENATGGLLPSEQSHGECVGAPEGADAPPMGLRACSFRWFREGVLPWQGITHFMDLLML